MIAVSPVLLFAAAAAAAVDTSTLKGKWLYGYQGWFRTPGAGVNSHWCPTGSCGPGDIEIDFIPDVSAYPSNCLFDTGLTAPDGSAVQFYDNTCDGVVDLHFSWMSQYGVDGILVQRFLGSIADDTFTTILDQVQAAAEKYGLGFVVEYDISGGDSSQGSVADEVMADFTNTIKAYTASSAYIHQDGQPVVMAYGVGYSTSKVTADDAEDLCNQMKSAGNYIAIGTPTQWQQDVNGNTGYVNAYKAANLISPWTVGAYSNANYEADYFETTQTSDAQLASSLGIDYAPVIWPGTSADHLNGGNTPANLDYFPRFNGSFYNLQATSVMKLDPMFIFTAMFDEVNEGTGSYACLKVEDLPTNEVFVGIDNDFSDTNHYLELGGQLAATFHSQSS